MTLGSCFLYAKKVFFSKSARGADKTAGHRSLSGAVACIAVSLVPLVAVISVSSGMISGITGRLITLSSHDIQVVLDSGCKKTETMENFLEAADSYSTLESVVKVNPEVRGMGLAAGASYRSGATIRAVKQDVFNDSTFSDFFHVVEGTVDLTSKKNAVIGQKLAQDLELHPGDTLRLISLSTKNERISPKVNLFKVTGIVSSGYQELDALWVFVPLENAFTSFRGCSMEFILGLDTDCTFDSGLEKVMSDVRKKLVADEDSGSSTAGTWRSVNAAQFENFASTKALLVVIMFAIILVASINISSAIVMIVMERRKEIAILKSTGGSSSGIALAFVMTGLFAGISGILIGVPCGLLVSVFINPIISGIEVVLNFVLSFAGAGHVKLLDPAFYLQEIPVVIPWNEVALIIVMTLILSAVMSVIPSVRAGKSKIIETLSKN
ncbi:MAG: ABC transporter permease [Treponema sp.]|nr:ABC transporter permease [Candidatus Treponema equi]